MLLQQTALDLQRVILRTRQGAEESGAKSQLGKLRMQPRHKKLLWV